MTGSSAREAARRTAQRAALRAILPNKAETELLRAILWSGQRGREAWEGLRTRLGGLAAGIDRLEPAQRGLLPLLHVAALRNGIVLGSEDATYLRAAHLREELRGHAYRRIQSALLEILAEAGLRVVILKGCALADTVYPDPATRHSHGIELLVHEADLARLPTSLTAAGFDAEWGYGTRHHDTACLSWRHERGLPLDLRLTLFEPELYRLPAAELWDGSKPLPHGHAHARMLSPEHNLLHAAAGAVLAPSRVTLRWACDAWYLLARHGPELDWPAFLAAGHEAHLTLPLSLGLAYLARELDAPIPPAVVSTFEADALVASPLAHEVALLAGLTGAHSRMRAGILSAPTVRAKLDVLGPLLLPSRVTIRAFEDRPRWLAHHHASRWFRYVLRRLRRAGTRTIVWGRPSP
ncbi:MAG: nucleotidyltransferase family protein [Geminicoccaceae bacterium]